MSDSASASLRAVLAQTGWSALFAYLLFSLLPGFVLFLTAGTFRWTAAWVFLIVHVAFAIGSRAIVLVKNPDLLVERARSLGAADAKAWDRVLSPIIGLFIPPIIWVVAGLDHRLMWSPELSVEIQAVALLVFIAGYGFATWAIVANPFFSGTVRIQTERRHHVITDGPYRHLRHPGYTGAVLASFAVPLMLGSLWALIPGAFGAAVTVARTTLEDRVLHKELAGYSDYARSVRYRLIPGIW